jgi:methylene-tetrahydromethanopterin dehydrogenase
VLARSQVALCAARAGLQVLSREQLELAPGLLVAADVNAVPPAGIEGLGLKANGEEISRHGALAIGPLVIGDIKYRTESGLFKAMIDAKEPVFFDFRDAFARARELVAKHG